METDTMGALAFGRHTFDPARCELRTAGGAPVPLGQRAARLLQALIEAGGRVLSRDDLLRRAWPGQDIDDGNLRVQIAALRRALADDRALIGTVAGRGYLFAGRAERRAAARPRLPGPAPHLAGCAPAGPGLVDDVLARVAASRFVTLAGAPGIGKTALALAAAHRHGGTVAWAGLDAAGTEEGMLAIVAAALGRQPGQRWSPAAGLAARLPAALHSAPALLVLDNCEHLADACSRLVETLLAQCPELRVLATSRQPLLASGETVLRVPALDLPPPGETDPARLAGSGAVALFVARAAAASKASPHSTASHAAFTHAASTHATSPHVSSADVASTAFLPDAADLMSIAAICHRLDGLPLAIELAAAQVPALGLRRIAAGLDDMLRLLQGPPGATTRHRTLRAALDWSHVLLPPAAQEALRRLARLPAWFTLDEAAAVLRPSQSAYEAIDSLGVLAAHSLLAVEHGHGARFRLLSTTRAYALSLGNN
ncbi:winged helix-turn-helix domain-containing protein [Pseudoduganella sp. SL102]|uniref:ATP-binding protein n=1 Tax=Pseudoduganella sp. SL102 TaxID=2995154 RepID=UPI00248BEEF5|nr:winged helix-turn-helix domain-containing protein [Pseudoduganella sp. SL102]WBS00968.1 winged helix-turn-helix domain-containing protein [Pseudoduganella sp. SL102]